MTRPGFTLVELLVVLLIVGLAAAVTAPALRIVDPGDPAGEDAAALVALLRQAHSRAVAAGRPVVLLLAAGGLYQEAGGDSVTAAGVLGLKVGRAPAAAPARWRFLPLGPAAGDTVQFRSAGVAWRVSVDPFTGDASASRE